MEFAEFKALAAAEAQKAGLRDYELYYVSEESTEISMFNGETDSFTASLTGGAAFRCIVGGRMGAACTQELSEAEAAGLVRRARDNALTLEKEEEAFFAAGGAVYGEARRADMPVLSPEALTEAASLASEALKTSHEKITDRCSVEAMTRQLRTCLVNSRGVDLSWNASVDAVYMSAVVADGRRPTTITTSRRETPPIWT